MMKYLMALLSTLLLSGVSLAADQDPVKLCTTLLLQKQQQAGVPNKISDAQASSYCQCAVPKLESLQKAAKTPNQQELTELFKSCMDKAGIKPS